MSLANVSGRCVFFLFTFHIVWSLGHNNFGQLYIKHVGVRCFFSISIPFSLVTTFPLA